MKQLWKAPTDKSPIRHWALLIAGILALAVVVAVLFAYTLLFGGILFGSNYFPIILFVATLVVIGSVLAYGAAARVTPIARINYITGAYIVACIFLGLANMIANPDNRAWVLKSPHFVDGIAVGLFFGSMFFFLAIVPASLAVWYAEYAKMRSPIFYAVMAAVMASPILFSHGKNSTALDNWLFVGSSAVAGLVYWAVVGRTAGAWRNN